MHQSNADNFYSYIRGWTAGAGSRPIDPLFANHENESIKEAYMDGWGNGRAERHKAFRNAEKLYGYSPSVIRVCDCTDEKEEQNV